MNWGLKNLLEKEFFQPGILSVFINPFHFARKGLYKNIKKIAGEISGEILDVGCGIQPYKNLFLTTRYVGMELDTPANRRKKKADVFYDGCSFPFSDDRFDCVIATQVLEHIFEPDLFLYEIRRVLKDGGKLLLTVPFLWDEHEQPNDYARYSSFGLKYLLEKCGFSVITQEKSMDDIRAVFQIAAAFLYKIFETRNPYANTVIAALVVSPLNIIGELLSLVTPRNRDLYLDNLVLAKKSQRSNC